jgi:choline dehydrogenase
LAHRLTEDKKNSVAILEFGGSDSGPIIQMPSALSYPMNMNLYNWGYHTEPEEGLNGRIMACPRGKVIGGSSSINGMIYVRGNPADFDYWEESGASGWGFPDVLPYFKRQENSEAGDESWRGKSGPLYITRGNRENPLNEALVNSAKEAGFLATEDYNGFQQEGFGPADRTIWKGSRWSTASAYLKPALKTQKLKLYKNALVDKIIFNNNEAKGVSFNHYGFNKTIYASKEIICSAGSINSPLILQRSGIGPAKLLKKYNIKIVKDSLGVGENLQDHLEVYLQVESKKPISLYNHLNPISKALIGMRWLLFKSGLGATNHFETLGFIRSKENVSYPDIQYHLLPVAVNYDGSSSFNGHGFQLHIGPMRSKSRGWVRIKSDKASINPEIKFNYMSHPDDWVDFRNCIKITRKILQQPSFSSLCGKEIQPGENKSSDIEIDQFIKEKAESAYHPCGTSKMGDLNDPMSVVDPECKVIGVQNLRVVDSSIFPRITNGNINAPSIMVGEKASDIILGKDPLPRENLSPFKSN